MTAALAPARCPGCNAPVSSSLYTYPGVPVYLCGSTPLRIVCRSQVEYQSQDAALGNVRPLDPEERSELRTLFLELSPSVTTPAIGLCLTPGCEGEDGLPRVAINGACMTHWWPQGMDA